MHVIVVGIGEIGKMIVESISSYNEVTTIDLNEEVAAELANDFGNVVICGDSMDVNILNDAGIEDADAFIATTGDDKTNLLSCQLAKSKNVKINIALVRSKKDKESFKELGITPIWVGDTIKREIDDILLGGTQLIEVGNMVISAVEICDTCIICNKEVKESKLPKNITIVSIVRKNMVVIPHPNIKIEKGDIVIVLMPRTEIGKINKYFK